MIKSEVELAARKCKPCEGGTPPMSEKEVKAMLEKVARAQLERVSLSVRVQLRRSEQISLQ